MAATTPRDRDIAASIEQVRSDLPRILTGSEARHLGITESAVRHGVARYGWQRLTRGVVLTSTGPPTRADWIQAGLHLAGPHSALSGWDAVRLRGVGPAVPSTRAVLVLCRNGRHRRVGDAQIRPTFRPYDGWLMPGEDERLPYARIVGHARAVADTALSMRRADEVRALLNSSVQRRLCTRADLAAEMDRMPRAGSAFYRQALEDVLDGAHSVAEARASARLRAARVPTYELNVPVVTTDGVQVAELDVLWRQLRAVLEVDSRTHHAEDEDWDLTLVRHNALNRAGFSVEHHAPARIAAPDWGRGVARWLRARALDVGVSYRVGCGPLRPGPDGPAPVVVPVHAATFRS